MESKFECDICKGDGGYWTLPKGAKGVEDRVWVNCWKCNKSESPKRGVKKDEKGCRQCWGYREAGSMSYQGEDCCFVYHRQINPDIDHKNCPVFRK